jgi:drug/metabolite transporter (DMT)-like permease
MGYLVFQETPDLWTWTGGTLIFVTTVYIAQREARAARRPTVPTVES